MNVAKDDEYWLVLTEPPLGAGLALYSGALAQEINANAKAIKSPYDKNLFIPIPE